MPQVKTFRAPTAYEEEMLKAQRQQQLAEMLRQQAEAPEQEYSYQGIRAMPSIAGGLAKVLKSYNARKAEERADEAARAAREADVAGAEQVMRGLAPQARVAAPTAAEIAGSVGMPQISEEGAVSYGPTVQPQMRTEMVGPTAQERRDLLTQTMVRGTPMAQRYAQLMLSREPQVSVEALMEASPESRKKYQETGDYTVLEKPRKAVDMPTKYEEFLLASQNPQFAKFLTDTTGNKTIVLPGQKTVDAYTTELSKGMAGQDLAAIAAGDQAIPQIEMSYTVRDLLKQNPITGTGAQARLGLEKALTAAGFSKGDRLSVTENLSAVLAKTTLAAIPTSGLGSGAGFTGSDREFLEKAAAGQIEMTNANLQYLAELNEKVARANLTRSNQVRSRVRQMPDFSRIPGALPDIVAPPAYGTRLPPGATLDR